ncbi:MAG: hypothetical protein AAF721_01545 [Myxococcota bacterium]
MNDESGEQHYSEQDVAAALRRAAQLQVEAAERAELAIAGVAEPVASEGYARQDLIEAAKEAGIDGQFVEVALAEIGPGERAVARFDDATERRATRWLGTRRRSVSVSRIIGAPPQEAWKALVAVAEGEQWRLRLTGSSGGHPTRGGVATFTMQRLSEMVALRSSYNPLCYRMEQLEAWAVRSTLRDMSARTEVTFFVDLRSGALVNVRWARATTLLGGITGGGGGLAIGLGVAAGALAGGALAVLGGLGVGGLLAGTWRAMYRHSAEKLVTLLADLLQDVEAQVERHELVGTD